MKAAHERGEDVARVHSGDPSIYGAIAEQMRRLDALGSLMRSCPACRPSPPRRRAEDGTDAAGNRPDDHHHPHRHEGLVDAGIRDSWKSSASRGRRWRSICRSATSTMSAERWSPITARTARWSSPIAPPGRTNSTSARRLQDMKEEVRRRKDHAHGADLGRQGFRRRRVSATAISTTPASAMCCAIAGRKDLLNEKP